MRQLLAAVAVLTLITAGCGGADGDDAAATTTSPAAVDAAYHVQVDGDTDDFIAEFTAYFPAEVKVHPGDKLSYDLTRFSGAPHTVTLGTIIDTATTKLAALGPSASLVKQETSIEMLAVDDLFPHAPTDGPPKPNQTAAQPCFLATGEVPGEWLKGGAAACPKAEQPEFDGTQAFFNSGAMVQDGQKFEMTVAPSTKPGTYSVMCVIHRGAMTGKLTVVDADTAVPSPDDQAAAGKAELDAIVAKLKPIAESIRSGKEAEVFAGAGDPSVFNAAVTEFGPAEVSIPVGGTVTWTLLLFHSVTFNSSPADLVVASPDPDGNLQFNLKALGNEGFNTPPEAFAFPPVGKPILINGGKWDGEGFRNTGIVGSLPPDSIITVRQTFTKAGTYEVQCLLHPEMKGSVKVG